MERTRKHQDLTSASANFIFRSSVNKAEQDFREEQRKQRLQLHREALKRREQVVLMKKQARKHRKLEGSEVPADVSVKQPNKGLGSKRR